MRPEPRDILPVSIFFAHTFPIHLDLPTLAFSLHEWQRMGSGRAHTSMKSWQPKENPRKSLRRRRGRTETDKFRQLILVYLETKHNKNSKNSMKKNLINCKHQCHSLIRGDYLLMLLLFFSFHPCLALPVLGYSGLHFLGMERFNEILLNYFCVTKLLNGKSF